MSVSLAYEADGGAGAGAPSAVVAPQAAPGSEAPLPFAAIGRLPFPTDNVAIAGRRVEAGTKIEYTNPAGVTIVFTLENTVLEGHRCVESHRFIVVDPPSLGALLCFCHGFPAFYPLNAVYMMFG